MTNEITQADRELLAAEYEREGWETSARYCREGDVTHEASICLRAIAAARQQTKDMAIRALLEVTDTRTAYAAWDRVETRPQPPVEAQPVAYIHPDSISALTLAPEGAWLRVFTRGKQPPPDGWAPVYTSPPSAPVGVEWLPEGWMRDRKEAVALAEHLENAGWRADERGDIQCFDQGSAMAAEVIRLVLLPMLDAQQPAAEYKRQQPCGCVLCVCEDEKQCHGCGAKHCGNRTDHPAYVAQQPAAESPPVGVEEMQRRLDREESGHLRTIDQRDAAEDALGRMFQTVTDRPAEWSSAWGYADAIKEVEEHVASLAQQPAPSRTHDWNTELLANNERLAEALRHLRNHTSVNSHQIELIDTALHPTAAQEAGHG